MQALTPNPSIGLSPVSGARARLPRASHHASKPNPRRETLTKKVRRSLVFLDKHMSSTRRDVKYLKVPFGMRSSQRRERGRKEKGRAAVRSARGAPAAARRGAHPSPAETPSQKETEQIVRNVFDGTSVGFSSFGERGETSYKSICRLMGLLCHRPHQSPIQAKLCFLCSSAHRGESHRSASWFVFQSLISRAGRPELTHCHLRCQPLTRVCLLARHQRLEKGGCTPEKVCLDGS